MKAPLGWDNTTEMVATVVDAVNYLARLVYNANAKEPDTSDLPRIPRPYGDEIKPEPESISLNEFTKMLREG